MHGTVSRRLADGISPRPPFAWPSPKNVLFITAANTYLWIDATYVKVRQNGRIVSVAVIIAVGVNSDGRAKGGLGETVSQPSGHSPVHEFR